MASSIPINNLYHMLCYAWDALPQAKLLNLDTDDCKKPVDLFSKILIGGVNHLLRRGVEQGYQLHSEEMRSVRGRVDIYTSARRLLLSQGKALCQFDELTPNTLANQILKATLLKLTRTKKLDPGLKKNAVILSKKFNQVSDARLTAQLFRRVQLHGNNRFYKFILDVCELIFHEVLLNENTGQYEFRDFQREDNKALAALYEKFLLNFYRKNQSKFNVKSERLSWKAVSEQDQNLSLLPTMLTDLSFRSASKTIIMDAKFYSKTLQENYGTKKVSSNNLYQIFCYLKCIEHVSESDANAQGVLLYPTINQSLDVTYDIQGKSIRFVTVDLAKQWEQIENNLLLLIGIKS